MGSEVQVSNPVGEEPGSTQSEPSIAAWGSYVLAAYNDWPSLSQPSSILGYSYSVSGGQSFIDGGMLPAPRGFIWTGDPVVSVDEKTGEFYVCGLLEDSLENQSPRNGVGIVRGTFSGITFRWDVPRVVQEVFSSQHVLQKPWMVADSSSGNLYVTYTDFFPISPAIFSDNITFLRSRDGGVTWDPAITLNGPAADGQVQGARPAVGPAGEVCVVWKEIGPPDPGSDFLRIRESPDQGASFGVENTVTTLFDNYGTGAPGFNREQSVTFPSIGVDRSPSPNRGRVYVSWHESLNWFDDAPPLGERVDETEYNDPFAHAVPFTVGQTLYGTFRDTADYDSWSFPAIQDSSYIFWADSVTNSTYRLRIFCTDSLTRLAFTGYLGTLDTEGNPSIMMWTAPTTDTYYLDMTNAIIDGAAAGTYRIRTGYAHRGQERGRDQRDVFVSSSLDGASWLTPVRVNQDPPHFDNWLPEVMATPNGKTYVEWYDWRDAPATACGGFSSVYLALSENGATTWTTLGAVTGQLTNWTQVAANLVPNQGDYLGICATETLVLPCWTDGRLGTPDIDAARLVKDVVPTLVSLVEAQAQPDRVRLVWFGSGVVGGTATVYRRSESGGWASRGSIRGDGAGRFTYEDRDVAGGARYGYRLGILENGVERFFGEAWIDIPSAAVLGLDLRPNPSERDLLVSFTLAGDAPATLDVFDAGGRRVLARRVADPAPGRRVLNLRSGGTDLGPGLYVVRLTQGGRSVAEKLSVIW